MDQFCIPNDDILHRQCDDAEFIEVHLDERYSILDQMTLYSGKCTESGAIIIQANTKHFSDPDQCIHFITTCEWRKVFLTLTDYFSYLLPMIHDLPQIACIYIYSSSPEKISYSCTIYKKLRAIVDENSPDANKPLLNDIDIFRRDLLPIKVIDPIQRKTKLLIQEPLVVDEYRIIWIEDKDIDKDIDKKSVTDIINCLDIFSSIDECINGIKLLSENIKIFLISSYSDVDRVIKELGHLSNVIAIYIFDHGEQTTINFNDSTSKVHGPYGDLDSLSKQLSYDYKNLTHNSLLSISIFSREQNEKTVRDLSKESARFLWLQLLIDILIRTPFNDQAKDEMLNECRIHYKDDPSALRKMDEFDETYESSKALRFYTHDSFVYRLFNRALRTENIDFLFIFRFFLNDMYKQLQTLYIERFLNKFKNTDEKLFVYRGQSMKTAEFDQIKNNVGRLISIGTFFSTTKDRGLAVIYSGSDNNNREPDLLPVIFEIEINLNHDVTKRPVASIEHLSQYPEEREVLFSVGSTFRIVDIEDRQTSDKYWLVKMVMVEEDSDLNELRNVLEKEYFSQGSLCDLGNALIAMCDYERAERFYNMLLEYLPEHHPSMGHIQTSLGIIYANRGDYERALKFQETALEIYTRNGFHEQNKDSIGNTYVHIGAAYRHLGKLDLALKYCLMAADIQSPTGSLAFTYNEIAITYRDKGDNHLALEYFLKALHIDEQVLKLPKYHPTLATAYNNIGEIYFHLDDNDNALKYLEHALEIRLKGTVASHTDLAAIYHNLGLVYLRKNQLNKALEIHEKALDIDVRVLPSDHESLAHSHFAIAGVFLKLDEYKRGLDHAEKALRILLRSQAKDNHLMISKYQGLLGQIQYQLGDMKKALKMAEKALDNALVCPSENQIDLAHIYDLFASIYEKEGNNSMALEYANKAIEQAKIWAIQNRTFQLEYFLARLDRLKNNSLNTGTKYPTSFTASKIFFDHNNTNGELISQLNEELQKTPESNIEERLELLSDLIAMNAREKNYSIAMKHFNEANDIYIKYQSSDEIDEEKLTDVMISVFHNTARVYYRQQDWNMCLNMLTKSLNIVHQQHQEHIMLPEIYYCMAATYAHQQVIPLALYYYQLTISTAKKRLPHDHPDMQRYCFQFELFQKALREAHTLKR